MLRFSEWVHLSEQEMGQFGQNPGAPMGQSGPPSSPQPQPVTGAGGVSDPAHLQDEDSMDLNALIEKRLNMLIDELQHKKKRPKEELVQSFSAVIQQLMGSNNGPDMGAAGNQGMSGPPENAAGSASPMTQPQISA